MIKRANSFAVTKTYWNDLVCNWRRSCFHGLSERTDQAVHQKNPFLCLKTLVLPAQP